jgi:hypothetical protein
VNCENVFRADILPGTKGETFNRQVEQGELLEPLVLLEGFRLSSFATLPCSLISTVSSQYFQLVMDLCFLVEPEHVSL